MSQTVSALPGAMPAQRGAGSTPAPRNWRAARRLITLVTIPTLLGLAFAGLRVTDAMRNAAIYGQVSHLAMAGQQVTGLAWAMADERASTAAFIADGRPAAGLAALHRQYAITDSRAATVRRLVRQLGGGYPAQTRAGMATALASLAALPGLRRDAAHRQASALTVINGYSAATASLFPVIDGIADLSGNSALSTSVRALGSLSRMADQYSQQQAILGAALADGHLGPAALTALNVAQAQQASDLASFRIWATPEESWALTDTLAGVTVSQARAVQRRATAGGAGALALGARAGQQWQAGMSYATGWLHHAGQQLAEWITGYAQTLRRNAMRSAIITGSVALAVLALVLLATMIMVSSVVRPRRRFEAPALGAAGPPLAGEKTRPHGSVSAIFASFSRRNHALLERLPRLVDSAEPGEDDPERLASLFWTDQVATRTRRNADSVLALAGDETPGRTTEPVTLVDVVRAAVSEIEQYDRVVLNLQPGVSIRGTAVADTVHLLAELLDNATTFSPKSTQVTVSGHTARGGGLPINITDAGTGMSEEQLGQLNWQLAHPPLADPAGARHLGLFAVPHLAARHGIKVALRLPPGGGTTAEVHLPAALIVQDTRPGRWPGQAGDGLRARPRDAAHAVAAATVSWAPAPRVSAGAERAEGPQTGLPDAVPLMLGAPVPPSAPAGPAAVTVPEPAGAEPEGALPIFDSVESGYLRTRGWSPLRPGGPQPGQPASAEQPAPAAAAADTSAAERDAWTWSHTR